MDELKSSPISKYILLDNRIAALCYACEHPETIDLYLRSGISHPTPDELLAIQHDMLDRNYITVLSQISPLHLIAYIMSCCNRYNIKREEMVQVNEDVAIFLDTLINLQGITRVNGYGEWGNEQSPLYMLYAYVAMGKHSFLINDIGVPFYMQLGTCIDLVMLFKHPSHVLSNIISEIACHGVLQDTVICLTDEQRTYFMSDRHNRIAMLS